MHSSENKIFGQMKQRYTCTRMMGEGKSMERHHTICQTWWRQCYGMVVYGWWWNQIIGVNWWWYSLIIFSPMLLNWSDRSNLKVKKWYVLQWPDQSPDLKPNRACFWVTKHKTECRNTYTSSNWMWRQSRPIRAYQHLMMSLCSRLQAVSDYKGFSCKYKKESL